MAQLAAICAAAGAMPPQVSMFVVDGRGLGDVWTFVDQVETVATALGPGAGHAGGARAQQLIDWRQAWLDRGAAGGNGGAAMTVPPQRCGLRAAPAGRTDGA